MTNTPDFDTLQATLYLGETSRVAIGYGKVRGEQDHTWSEFVKMKAAFLKKHPDLRESLNLFMEDEKRKWRTLFNETFKLHSLALFVSKSNLDLTLK